jgi:hypothetical protein
MTPRQQHATLLQRIELLRWAAQREAQGIAGAAVLNMPGPAGRRRYQRLLPGLLKQELARRQGQIDQLTRKAERLARHHNLEVFP